MDETSKSMEKRTKCFCPMCNDYYYRRIFWTGRGTPRMFCPLHTQRISNEMVVGPDINDEHSISDLD